MKHKQWLLAVLVIFAMLLSACAAPAPAAPAAEGGAAAPAAAAPAGGTTFVRETVLEFVAPNHSGFLLRRWRQASAAPAPGSAPRALPPC